MKKVQQIFDTISHRIEKVEEWLLYLIFAETICVGAAQVVARALHASLPWSEELLRMSFEWVTFFGASIGISRNSHVAVTFFVDLLPKTLNKVAQIIGKSVCIAFFIILIRFGWIYFMLSYRNGQTSTAMEIPMAIPYGGMVIAFICMLLHTIAVSCGVLCDICISKDVASKLTE